MPKKTRQEKAVIVDDLREKITRQTASYVTAMSGLNVEEITELRRKVREAGGEFKVTKISLLKRASEGTTLEPIVNELTGPTAMVFAYEDPVGVARAMKGFADKVAKVEPVSGLLGDRLISKDDIVTLATLPSRDELLARMVGTIAAPVRDLVGIMAAVPRQLLYAFQAISDNKKEQ